MLVHTWKSWRSVHTSVTTGTQVIYLTVTLGAASTSTMVFWNPHSMCDDLGILLWETATQGAHSTLPGSEDASFFAIFTLYQGCSLQKNESSPSQSRFWLLLCGCFYFSIFLFLHPWIWMEYLVTGNGLKFSRRQIYIFVSTSWRQTGLISGWDLS